MRIGTDEEAGPVVDDPRRELVELAINRVEQEHAAHAVAEAAHFQAPRRRHKAAAVADDHDRHVGESPGGARIAVETGEVLGRLRHERLSPPGCQNLPALESAASTASCGASSTALTPDSEICCGTSCRSRTSRSSVAPLPWKNTTMTPGLRTSKFSGTCMRTRLSL